MASDASTLKSILQTIHSARYSPHVTARTLQPTRYSPHVTARTLQTKKPGLRRASGYSGFCIRTVRATASKSILVAMTPATVSIVYSGVVAGLAPGLYRYFVASKSLCLWISRSVIANLRLRWIVTSTTFHTPFTRRRTKIVSRIRTSYCGGRALLPGLLDQNLNTGLEGALAFLASALATASRPNL